MQAQQDLPVYHELVDLIANSDPRRVLEFRMSDETARRVETLVDLEKTDKIKQAEEDELDTYMHLSRIVMLAQARAHEILHGTRTSESS